MAASPTSKINGVKIMEYKAMDVVVASLFSDSYFANHLPLTVFTSYFQVSALHEDLSFSLKI